MQNSIEFRFTHLHPKQQEIALDPAKYKVICAGRRAGKSKFACSHVTFHAITTQAPYWWVAPTFRNTQAAWRELVALATQNPKFKVRIFKDEYIIEFPKLDTSRASAGFVQVVSGADPDNMRSAGRAGVVYDEAAFGQERVWTEILLPSLMDYDGWAMLISTPNGFNWFYNVWLKAEREQDGYKAFRFTSYDNLYIGVTPEDALAGRVNTPERVRAIVDQRKQTMLERTFRQDILAEFIDDALGVFRGIDRVKYRPEEDAPIDGHHYVMGVDWGRSHDYTAISVWDATERREVYLDRFNQIGWTLQRGRVAALFEKWRPSVIVCESNFTGEANIEELQKEGLPVRAFRMTNEGKKQLVERLALAIERADCRLLDDEAANDELRTYGAEVLPSGAIRYSAPQGGFDDTVVARMLAWSQVGEQVGHIMILDW